MAGGHVAAAFAVAVGAVVAALAAAQADEAVVRTTYGSVRGVVNPTHRVFYGIPHSSPPVGSLRWAAPRPPQPWGDTVRDATVKPFDCFQNDDGFWFIEQSEDCLYMNVFTPRGVSNSSRLAVMVFFYGGSLENGGISLPVYNGAGIVELTNDVVVVTVNYRLNVFGFLGGPALATESGSGANGNYGFLDQRNALIWVRDNIANFGGDPSRVLIFGESAGSWSVNTHLVMPRSAQLFHRAVMESGAHNGLFLLTQERANEQYSEFLAALNCTTLACLRAVPAADIVERVPISRLGDWGAIIDGVELRDDPRTLVQRGEFTRVPVVIGSNADEIAGTLGADTTEAEYRAFVQSVYGPEDGAKLLEVYPLSDYENAYFATQQILTDDTFTCPALRTARWMSPYTSVYAYRFAFVNSVIDRIAPELGAFHAAELPYVFNFDPLLFNDNDRLVAKHTVAYWTNTAHTGNPNTGTQAVPLQWPGYGSQHIVIDDPPSTVANLKQAQCAVFDEIAEADKGAVPRACRAVDCTRLFTQTMRGLSGRISHL